MNFLKKFIGLSVGLLLLLVVIVVVLAYTMDLNEYKNQITQQVEKSTGRALTIDGDINVSVWPWLGLQLGSSKLANAAGFEGETFASVEQFGLKLELLPLLKKQIHIDRVLLHGLVLNLQKNAQGLSNWSDLSKPAATQPDKQSKPSATDDELGKMLGGMAINGLEIKRGRLSWDDAQTSTHMSVQDINLLTGAVAANENVPASLSFRLKLNEPDTDMNFKLETEINVDMASMHVLANKVALELRVLSPKLAAQNTLVNLTTDISAKINEQQYKISQLVMDVHTKGYQLPGGELELKLQSSAVIDMKQQRAEIESLQVDSTGVRLTSSASVSDLSENPSIEGSLNIAEFNFSQIAKTYKITLPAMADAQALKKVSAQWKYKAKADEVTLSDVSLQIDDTSIKGHLAVKNFAQPEVNYDLKLSEIDLNRYLPVPPADTVQSSESSAPPSDVPIELPLDTLRKLNLAGVLSAEKINWQQYTFEKLYIKMQGKQGVISASPINFNIFDGRVALAGKLDVRSNKPQYTFNIAGKQLQMAEAAKPVLVNLLGEKDVTMEGLADWDIRLNTQGNSMQALMSALSGNVTVDANGTQLKNIDIEQYFRKKVWYALDTKIRKSDSVVLTMLRQDKFPTTQEEFIKEYKPSDKTVFRSIAVKANIKQGVVDNYEFLMASDRVNVVGKGNIYLTNQRMEYVAAIDLNRPADTMLNQMLDVPMKIKLNGPFAEIKPQPDFSAWMSDSWDVAVSRGKKRAEEKIETEVKAKVKEKAKDKVQDLLKQWRF